MSHTRAERELNDGEEDVEALKLEVDALRRVIKEHETRAFFQTMHSREVEKQMAKMVKTMERDNNARLFTFAEFNGKGEPRYQNGRGGTSKRSARATVIGRSPFEGSSSA